MTSNSTQVRDSLIEQLRERISHLESACNIFEKGSEENCEVFDVLMAAGRISMTAAEERLCDVVEELLEENKRQATQLQRLRSYVTEAIANVERKMNVHAAQWTTAKEQFGIGSMRERVANEVLHDLRSTHMSTFHHLRKAFILSEGDQLICENCCKDPCARHESCGRSTP